MIAKLVIRVIHNITQVLSPHHSDGRYHSNRDLTFQQHIDPILELKSPSRVKPKDRLRGAKNKKRSQTEAELDDLTRCKLSMFEYKEGKDKSKTYWSKGRI